MKQTNSRFIPNLVGEFQNQACINQLVSLLDECANAFSSTIDGDTLALTSLSVAGASTFTLGATDTITVDAGTTDHTGANVLTMDVDVNSANCKAINIDLDVGTALGSGEKAYGVYVDVAGLSGDNAGGAIGAFYANGDTTSGAPVTGLTLAGAWDTALTISGTSTTALSITGAATTAISVTAAAAETALSIDAATTAHTGSSIITGDLHVNSAACIFINLDLDVSTALSSGEYVYGAYFDVDGAAGDNGNSGVVAYCATSANTSGGTTIAFDVLGTWDYGLALAGACATGVSISGASTTAISITGNATTAISVATGTFTTALSITGSVTTAISVTAAAGETILNIDAATTAHTAGNLITADLHVNSANCRFISADIDVSTALSSGENVYGIYLDLDGHSSDAADSGITGIYLTSANTTTGVNNGITIAGTWDNGINVSRGTYINAALQVGAFASSYATGSAIAFSATCSAAIRAYGESTADLTSAVNARTGVFRHLIVTDTASIAHETYGVVGQVCVKNTTLTHLHAGVMGTFEVSAAATVNSPYGAGAACVTARLGCGTSILTATTPICGFSAIYNGGALASGSSYGYATAITASTAWTYGIMIPSSTAGIGIGIGTSGTPFSLTTYANAAAQIYTTTASTDGSNTVQPVLIDSTMTGVGGVGRALRCTLNVTNVALGGWSNAIKGLVDYKTSGSTSGLGSAICAEMVMCGAAMAASGTYGVYEAELVCPSSWSGTNKVSFLHCAVSGATLANFLDYGNVLALYGMGEANAGHIFDTCTAAAASHALRIDIDGTPYYILLQSNVDA